MNKAAKTVLKGQLQKRKLDEIAFTAVSKLSLEQVHEKRKLKAPEMAKKALLSPPSITLSLCQICKEVQKPHCGQAFWMNAQKSFFQLPKLK